MAAPAPPTAQAPCFIGRRLYDRLAAAGSWLQFVGSDFGPQRTLGAFTKMSSARHADFNIANSEKLSATERVGKTTLEPVSDDPLKVGRGMLRTGVQ